MTNPFNTLDRFRERFGFAWLDDADWKTWCWHAVLALLGGIALSPFFGLRLGWWIAVLAYAVRELLAIEERRDLGMPLKPLDHAMDVLAPLIATEFAAWWWFRVWLP